MRSLSYILCAWLVLGIAACGLLPGNEPVDRVQPPPDSVNGLFELALSPERDATAVNLVELLGTPRAVRSEAVPNIHQAGQIDSLRTITYNGLIVQLYEVYSSPETGQGERSFLVRLELLDEIYSSPEGLSVGDSVERLREVLGEPDYHTENIWHYTLAEDDSVQLEVLVQQGEVGGLTWHFIVD